MLGLATAMAQPLVEFPELDQLGSARMRGMGGAFTGVGESAGALLVNPAAMGLRRPLSVVDGREVDVSLQVRDHPALALGQPPPTVGRARLWQAGVIGHTGAHGAAAHVTEQSWSAPTGDLGVSMWSVGVGTAGRTWSVGALPHVVAWQAPGQQRLALGGTVGALWAPDGLPIRLGARVRSPIRAATPGGGVRVPPVVAIGASYSVRAVNRGSEVGPLRQQARWGAPLVMIAADVVWTGPSADAVALEPWLAHGMSLQAPGTLGWRAGAEVWAHRQDLRLRGGAYQVPERGGVAGRLAATGGAAYEVWELRNGLGVRLAGAVEAWHAGWSWTVGIETW